MTKKVPNTPFPCPFLVNHILVYLFYLCPSWDRSIINKAIANAEKSRGNWVKDNIVTAANARENKSVPKLSNFIVSFSSNLLNLYDLQVV